MTAGVYLSSLVVCYGLYDFQLLVKCDSKVF